MLKKQSIIETLIKDVNCEDGLFLQFCGHITDSLFSLIKWAGIPFVIYVVIAFLRL